MIYLLMFATSLTLMYLGLKSSKKISKRILIFLSLFLPCLMAGLRNVSVGTDTNEYVYRAYNISNYSNSLIQFIRNSKWDTYRSDYLYMTLTWIICKLGFSFNFLLFIYECLIIFTLYLAIKRINKNNINLILGMFVFYLLFYNATLNMVRQSIAISFILLSFSYLYSSKGNKERFLSLLYTLIAIGFHSSAIICIPILLLYILYNNIKLRNKIYITILLVTLSILFLIFYKPILLFLGNSKIYKKAIEYLTVYSFFDINYTKIILNIFLLIFILISKKEYLNNKIDYEFGIMIGCINFIITLLGTFVHYADRISYYLFYLIILFYVTPIDLKKKNNKILMLSLLGICLAYWIYIILLKNVNNTLPYVFYK